MQTKETLQNAIIILDREEDFLPNNLEIVFSKIKEYKKLPFHDVLLKIDLKNFEKFFDVFNKKKINYQEAETKINTVMFKF
jgi:hypothetical protein